MTGNNQSIQRKVYFALAGIFLVVMIVVISIAVSSEQHLSRQMVHTQLTDKASSYLDTMNILMVSGAIANRESLRQKILSDESITEARILRHSAIDALYGKGFPHEYPKDDIDRRALSGEEIFFEQDNESGHTITYAKPLIAKEDFRGTNCLGCHQAQEGDILGAVRITYDLAKLDNTIEDNMLMMGLTQAAMFIGALIFLSTLLRKVVLKPIKRMHKTLSSIEKKSDLTIKAKVTSKDEIGETALALNSMTARFHDSLIQVVNSTEQLETAASHIDTSSRCSFDAAEQQKRETNQIQQSIESLHHSIRDVMSNAEQSTQASNTAKQVATDGVNKTDDASATIQKMNTAIQTTAEVISTLDERSSNVGGVLEVIKGIAEQTNLLALNAAIEAARAGESGRGFAVVADEVRTLSQKTHESTQEIESMIDQLQDEAKKAVNSMKSAQQMAEEGMERVNEAASALTAMTSHLDQMDQLNTETLQQMQDQVNIGDNVSQGIESISQHSISTADSAEQTTKESSNLVSLSNHLTTLVKQFKI